MIAFLPVSLTLLIWIFSRQEHVDWREVICKSIILLFFLIAASTEILSLFYSVSYLMLSIFWVSLTIILSTIYFLLRKTQSSDFSIMSGIRTLVEYIKKEPVLFLLLGIILTVTLFISLLSPPNNFDSMAYHMARVAQWIDHKNINFYPTHISRQNYQMPLSEFAILHLQLLSKSDRFANLVQWSSFFISILLASLVTKEFKGSFRTQLLSALFAATIPMAILQSSSTQNDVVTSMFCTSFAYFLMKLKNNPNHQNMIFCSLSFGLALLTKGTAYIYCCAIGSAFGIFSLLSAKSANMKHKIALKFIIIIIIGLTINIGHLTRNYSTYENPFPKSELYQNQKFSVPILFSNIIRNSALHLQTPSEKLNDIVVKSTQVLLGNQLNNPQTTWRNTKFKKIPFYFRYHEDYAGNLPHFILILLSFSFLLFVSINIDERRKIRVYVGSVIFGLILFCSYLKWQPWITRLHTPLFILSAPIVAIVISHISHKNKILFYLLAIFLFLYSTPFLFINNTRPLLPIYKKSILNKKREEMYFVGWPALYKDYVTALKLIKDKKADKVGLYIDGNSYEYPIWVLAENASINKPPHFKHIDVRDKSASLYRKTSPPTFILATKHNNANVYGGLKYDIIFYSKHIKVLKLKNHAKVIPSLFILLIK